MRRSHPDKHARAPHSDPCARGFGRGGRLAESDAQRRANAHEHSKANANSDTGAANTFADPYANSTFHADACAHADTDASPDADAGPDADADSPADANSDRVFRDRPGFLL